MREGDSKSSQESVDSTISNNQQQVISNLHSTPVSSPVVPERTVADKAIRVDPSSVSQGVQQGQQQAAGNIKTSVQEGTVQGQQQAATELKTSVQQGTVEGQQSVVQATTQDSQQIQRNAQASSENTSALRDVVQTYRQAGQPSGSGPPVVNSGSENRSSSDYLSSG
jgi:hypothetical protein